jgi:hypothetical protein
MKRFLDRILFMAVVATAMFLSRVPPAYADIPNFGAMYLMAGGGLVLAILIVTGLVFLGVRIIIRIRRKTLEDLIQRSGREDGRDADRKAT